MSDVRHVLLTVWNPIGCPVPDDEYDSYVPHITGMLISGADGHRLTDHLFGLETVSMGLLGDRARCSRTAERLLAIPARPSQAAQDLERRAQDLKSGPRDYAGALRLRLELERLQQDDGATLVEKAGNLNQIAHVAVHAGRLAEAERAARQCVAIYRPLTTDRDERLATYLMMLSCVLAEGGQFEEAARVGEEAVAIFVLNHGEQDDFVAARWRDIGRMRASEPRPYLDK